MLKRNCIHVFHPALTSHAVTCVIWDCGFVDCSGCHGERARAGQEARIQPTLLYQDPAGPAALPETPTAEENQQPAVARAAEKPLPVFVDGAVEEGPHPLLARAVEETPTRFCRQCNDGRSTSTVMRAVEETRTRFSGQCKEEGRRSLLTGAAEEIPTHFCRQSSGRWSATIVSDSGRKKKKTYPGMQLPQRCCLSHANGTSPHKQHYLQWNLSHRLHYLQWNLPHRRHYREPHQRRYSLQWNSPHSCITGSDIGPVEPGHSEDSIIYNGTSPQTQHHLQWNFTTKTTLSEVTLVQWNFMKRTAL